MAECKTKITLCDDAFTVCGDVNIGIDSMLSTDISTLSSLNEFRDTITSELIDAKAWKTTSAYPTLRLLYERYLNSTQYCDTLSSQFTYDDMFKFSELVGTYWVDLIEQVVPATTIWGSTYVYGNTMFDQQKFTYKKYSLFGCDLPNYVGDVVSPTSGWVGDVEIEFETLVNNNYDEVSGSTSGETFSNSPIKRPLQTARPIPKPNKCNGVGIIQTNCGSEFIGTISIIGDTTGSPNDNSGHTFNAD